MECKLEKNKLINLVSNKKYDTKDLIKPLILIEFLIILLS